MQGNRLNLLKSLEELYSEVTSRPRPVSCYLYGMMKTVRIADISLGGLKLDSNFEAGVGETINFAILTNAAEQIVSEDFFA